MSEGNKSNSMSRRRFLSIVGSASAAAVLAACAPAAGPGAQTAPTAVPQVSFAGTELSFLTWNNFVPEMDTELDKICKAWGEKNKVTMKVEHINANDIAPRRAAAVQAKSGPDLIWDGSNWPVLFKDSLLDISDVVEDIGKQVGGWYPFTAEYAKPDGKWRAIPHAYGGGAFAYRTDMFKQNNVAVPKTWDDFMKSGAVMKKAGKPFGQAIGHSFGDPPGFWYPWLWSHGGQEVQKDGKTVALDSPETLLSVEKAVELFKTALDESGIAWDDSNNNRAYLDEQISCTLNGSSIYFVAGRDAAKGDAKAKRVFENTDHFSMLAGPKGSFIVAGGYFTGIMSYTKNAAAAKDLLRYLMEPTQMFAWLDSGKGYLQGLAKKFEEVEIFKKDVKMKPFLDNLLGGPDKGRWYGWPGPNSAEAYRVYNNYFIVDMYAKACSGELKPKDAVTWATNQLKTIYK
jgi:multiple sugar transport system substrate-binding protein